jgi:hypothetical protein
MASLLPNRNRVVSGFASPPPVPEPPKTLYIHVRCSSDLNDCLNQLWTVTTYARNNGREIVLEMPRYTGDLLTILDFTKYPVKVHTDLSVLPTDAKRATFNPEGKDKAQVLVHDKVGGGIQSAHVFRFIRLQPMLVESLKSLPVLHSAIHIGATVVPVEVLDVDATVKEFVSAQRSRPLFLVAENEAKQAAYVKKYGCFARPVAKEETLSLMDAVFDLMIMMSAKDLLCIPGADNKVSGLAVLAKELQPKRLFVRDLVQGKPMA